MPHPLASPQPTASLWCGVFLTPSTNRFAAAVVLPVKAGMDPMHVITAFAGRLSPLFSVAAHQLVTAEEKAAFPKDLQRRLLTSACIAAAVPGLLLTPGVTYASTTSESPSS